MAHVPEIDTLSVVLRGKFNPSIFHPTWLAAEGLVPKQQAVEAAVNGIKVIHDDIASFEIDEIFIEVLRDRFSAATSNASQSGTMRDLVRGIFTLLEFTPLTAMGMNRLMHFRLQSNEQVAEKLQRLYKPAPWSETFQSITSAAVRVEGRTEDEDAGILRVDIEDSKQVTPGGLFIGSNEHHAGGLQLLMDRLDARWFEAMSRARQVADHVLSLDEG